MANFNSIIDSILQYEGGYVNDKDDAGGETFRGIARNCNKDWEGWKIIDAYKTNNPKDFKQLLMKDMKLLKLVKDCYKRNYWDTLNLDNEPSQRVANDIFDMAVNAGVSTAKKLYNKVKVKTEKYKKK